MKRAFTLIEVLITIALSTILLFAIVQLYIVYGRVIVFQNASIEVALGASSIMDSFRSSGLQASQVVATHAFAGVDYNSGATSVVFKVPSINASGSIISSTYDYIGISSSGTDAYRLVDAAVGSARTTEKKRLTGVLEAISFTYDNQSFPLVTNVILNATTSTVVRGEMAQQHLNGRIYLRNL